MGFHRGDCCGVPSKLSADQQWEQERTDLRKGWISVLPVSSRELFGGGTPHSWTLSDVDEISVITDGRKLHTSVDMNPGIKVTFQNHDSTLLGAMPYAEKFSKNLKTRLRGQKDTDATMEDLAPIMEDPDVIVWAFVGETAVMHVCPQSSQLISGKGLLYVKNEFLYYQSRQARGGTKRSWPLSDVKYASAVTDGRKIHKSVDMDPGIKTVFQGSQGSSTLVSSMPYAEKFSKKLNRHIHGPNKSKKKKEKVRVVAMMA
jgi:hypothetical protein